MNVMGRQKFKVPLLRSCGRWEIPVQQSLLLGTIPMERCANVGGMLEGLMQTLWKKQWRKRSILLTSRQSIWTNFLLSWQIGVSVQDTWLAAVICQICSSRVQELTICIACNNVRSPQNMPHNWETLNYHVRDIHEWEDGNCDFHPSKMCTCKMCDGNEDPECEGSPYKTKHPLSCAYHWLVNVLECEKRSREADLVNHPSMGRGHSNLCEAGFTVLSLFHSKPRRLSRWVWFIKKKWVIILKK